MKIHSCVPCVVRTETGGGFGNPKERDPELVRSDVLDGYVTVEGAKRDYGVVLDNDLNVEQAATVAQRATM